MALAAGALGQSIPAPDDFAGFPIGSDGNLLRWEKIVEYFEILADNSDRVSVRELGKTHNGNPFILATITSPKNMARLDQIQAVQKRIAYPGALTQAEIEEISENSPAVVLVTCNIHATEIGASQMAVEVAHDLATSDSVWTRRILDNVVFLLVPSFNPDGQIIVTDWNNRVRGTENVWAPLPWLYHPYIGHDNNRDAYMMTQPESRYGNRILFQEWFPQVYVDQHQQGNNGMRVFVPPFANPINPNVDPAIWAQAGKIGFAMYQALHEAGIDGVGYDQKYTGWWQGGFLRGAWFHNIVGLLTEVASANLASPVFQAEAKLGQPTGSGVNNWLQERDHNPEAPMPPPTDVMPRYDYPRPWLGGKWTLRDIINSELAITRALLESAADQRRLLIRTQIRMGLEAIKAGEAGDPWAYLFDPDQHDPQALYSLLEALEFCGVIVERAEAEFQAEGRQWPKGTFVIRMAQPFRAYAKDLLEPQEHPDPGAMPLGKMSDQPYDTTAWTLPLQMGVKAVVAKTPFEAELERLGSIPPPKGRWEGSGKQGTAVLAGPNALATLISRLQKKGVPLALVLKESKGLPAGSLYLEGAPPAELEGWTGELGLTAVPVSSRPKTAPLEPVRVALYRPWTASMDEGWTRWLLEQYEIGFTPLVDADLRAGDLRKRWDVLLLPGDRGDARLISGNNGKATPEEYRGGLGEEGRQAIREFVAQGGRLVVWHDAVDFALKTFELPVRDGLKGVPRSQFSCPGCFVRVQVDSNHPIGFGMQAEATAVFDNDSALEPLPPFRSVQYDVVARYPGDSLLQSGWMRGESHLAHRIAAAQVDYEQGSVVMIAFRPQFRAQPHGTFKLLFNAIHTAGLNMER